MGKTMSGSEAMEPHRYPILVVPEAFNELLQEQELAVVNLRRRDRRCATSEFRLKLRALGKGIKRRLDSHVFLVDEGVGRRYLTIVQGYLVVAECKKRAVYITKVLSKLSAYRNPVMAAGLRIALRFCTSSRRLLSFIVTSFAGKAKILVSGHKVTTDGRVISHLIFAEEFRVAIQRH